ncbi:MAG: adenosylmethionine decarboxylase [Bdellovibrionota bacterium]
MKTLGEHRIVDFEGCSFESLDDISTIRKMFERGLELSEATVIEIVMHKFSPQGVTGIAAIAESHVSIHTWPELGYAAIDVFSCGPTMKLDLLLSHFEKVLKPRDVRCQTFMRGDRVRLVSGQ